MCLSIWHEGVRSSDFLLTAGEEKFCLPLDELTLANREYDVGASGRVVK